jgi:hypothetical protein
MPRRAEYEVRHWYRGHVSAYPTGLGSATRLLTDEEGSRDLSSGERWTRRLIRAARARGTFPVAPMKLSHGRRRALHEIRQELTASDPDLAESFIWFNAQADGLAMPAIEKIRIWPLRLLSRLRRRGDLHRLVRARAS